MDFVLLSYWIAICLGGGSISILILMMGITRTPSLHALISTPIYSSLYLVLTLFNTPFLATVFYTTFKYFARGASRVNQKSKPKYLILVKSYLLCSVLFTLSIILMQMFKPPAYEALNEIFHLLIAVSGVALSYGLDYLYAILSDMMVPISMNFNHIILSLTLVSIVLEILVDDSAKFMGILAGILQLFTLSCYYAKLFFYGVFSLGARFMDIQLDFLTKEKQTILPEYFTV